MGGVLAFEFRSQPACSIYAGARECIGCRALLAHLYHIIHVSYRVICRYRETTLLCHLQVHIYHDWKMLCYAIGNRWNATNHFSSF